MRARTTIGVVIVICPAKAELILAMFLEPRGPVTIFPIRAFDFKEKVTGEIRIDQAKHPIQNLVGGGEPFRFGTEMARPSLPQFPAGNDGSQLCVAPRLDGKAAISAPLNDCEPRSVFRGE